MPIHDWTRAWRHCRRQAKADAETIVAKARTQIESEKQKAISLQIGTGVKAGA